MKRLISALMACALCVMVLPAGKTVQAATDGQLTYEIVDHEVTILDCDHEAFGTLVVPETIEGYPVTMIGDAAFSNCDFLTAITLPASLRVIGEKAFYDCNSLENIYFYGDAPAFKMSVSMCYDHEENPWDDLEFDFSAEHETGPFDNVDAVAHYFGSTSGWDAVTSANLTGGGCGRTEPQGKITLQQIAPASLSGTLIAFGEGAVSLDLTSQNSYPMICSESGSAYEFQNLLPGEYTLTLRQTGSVTRTYTLLLRAGETVLNLKIHQPGDLNGDGRYDIGDVARIYAHAKASKLLTGYELICADFTGDGKITVGDTAKAYSILQGK